MIAAETEGTCSCRYRLMLQWEDGTIAYHQNVITHDYTYPVTCGVLDMNWPSRHVVYLADTLHASLAHVLCEVDYNSLHNEALTRNRSEERTHRSETIMLSQPDQPSTTLSPSSFVICPDKHVTHAFLACDASSACWAENQLIFDDLKESWDIPSSSSCPASMTSLPPSFLCASGIRRVPYTLVCDHRADCLDNSDEDFCQFPPLEGISSLRCGGSTQVKIIQFLAVIYSEICIHPLQYTFHSLSRSCMHHWGAGIAQWLERRTRD